MASCKDCVHYEVCQMHYKQKCELTYETEREVEIAMRKAQKAVDIECDYYKDRSRFVELPCKVGDKVYCGSFGKLMEDEIIGITIDVNETRAVLKRGISYDIDKINQIFFFTREEAEQAIEGA